jgi:hypothetical protein
MVRGGVAEAPGEASGSMGSAAHLEQYLASTVPLGALHQCQVSVVFGVYSRVKLAEQTLKGYWAMRAVTAGAVLEIQVRRGSKHCALSPRTEDQTTRNMAYTHQTTSPCETQINSVYLGRLICG